MNRNFAITALGRSGTKFLANLMNKSRSWTVCHEPPPKALEADLIADVQPRFDRDCYGEVNSYLRRCIVSLDVSVRGVIVRDPMHVFLSTLNWKLRSSWIAEYIDFNRLCHYFDNELRYLDFAIGRGAEPISFSQMVGDIGYCADLLERCGIHDVVVTPEDLAQKVNALEVAPFNKVEDLPEKIVGLAAGVFEWYGEKYGRLF